MSRTGAHAQWKTGGASSAQPEPLYPVYNPGTGALDWSDTAPATAALAYDAGTGVVEVDDDPVAAGALAVVRLGVTTILSTT